MRTLECLGGPYDGDVFMVSEAIAEGEEPLILPVWGSGLHGIKLPGWLNGLAPSFATYRVGEDPTDFYNVVLLHVEEE